MLISVQEAGDRVLGFCALLLGAVLFGGAFAVVLLLPIVMAF